MHSHEDVFFISLRERPMDSSGRYETQVLGGGPGGRTLPLTHGAPGAAGECDLGA